MSDDHSGWLTAADVAAALGVSQATVSRMGTSGELVREKVDGVFLYDPVCVQARQSREPRADDGQSVAVVSASAALLRSLASLVPELVDRVIAMSREYQTASSQLITQLTERCKVLEESQTAMIRAREEYLDGATERELAGIETAARIERRDKLVGTLTEQLPTLIELAKLALEQKGDGDEAQRCEENS